METLGKFQFAMGNSTPTHLQRRRFLIERLRVNHEEFGYISINGPCHIATRSSR